MKIRYENTLDDIIAFNEYHLRGPWERTHRIMRVVVPCVILVAATAICFARDDFAWMPWVVLCTIFFVWFSRDGFSRSYRKTVERIVRKQYAAGRNEAVFCEHELELTADALMERTPVTESRYAFAVIEKIASTDTHTFLYTQTNMANVIPHERILEGDAEAFVTAVRAAIEKAQA